MKTNATNYQLQMLQSLPFATVFQTARIHRFDDDSSVYDAAITCLASRPLTSDDRKIIINSLFEGLPKNPSLEELDGVDTELCDINSDIQFEPMADYAVQKDWDRVTTKARRKLGNRMDARMA
jgi:hypothetical protein